MSDLEKLLKAVAAHVAEHPGDSGALLKAVAVGLDRYEAAVQARRDRGAWGALHLLACHTRVPKPMRTVPGLVDVAFHLFPTGTEGHSPNAVAFWEMFLAAARKEAPTDLDWLGATRGADCVTWWRRVVEPALAADAGIGGGS